MTPPCSDTLEHAHCCFVSKHAPSGLTAVQAFEWGIQHPVFSHHGKLWVRVVTVDRSSFPSRLQVSFTPYLAPATASSSCNAVTAAAPIPSAPPRRKKTRGPQRLLDQRPRAASAFLLTAALAAGCASVRVHDPEKEIIRGRANPSAPYASWADIYPFPILDGQTREMITPSYKQNGVDVHEQRGWLYGQGRGWTPPELDTNVQTQRWIEEQSGRQSSPAAATVSGEVLDVTPQGVQPKTMDSVPYIDSTAIQPIPAHKPNPAPAAPPANPLAIYGGTQGDHAQAPATREPARPSHEWNGDLAVVWFRPGSFELTRSQIDFLKEFAEYNNKPGAERVLYICNFEPRTGSASPMGLNDPRAAVVNGTLQAYGFRHQYIRPCDEPSARFPSSNTQAHTEIRAGGSAQTLTFQGQEKVSANAVDRILAARSGGTVKLIPNGDHHAGRRLAQVASIDLQQNLGPSFSGFSIAPVLPGPDTTVSVELY